MCVNGKSILTCMDVNNRTFLYHHYNSDVLMNIIYILVHYRMAIHNYCYNTFMGSYQLSVKFFCSVCDVLSVLCPVLNARQSVD